MMVFKKKNYYNLFQMFLYYNSINLWHVHDNLVSMSDDKECASLKWIPERVSYHSRKVVSVDDRIAIITRTPCESDVKPFSLRVYEVVKITNKKYGDFIDLKLVDTKEAVFKEGGYFFTEDLMSTEMIDFLKTDKWYNYSRFPLIPLIETSKANDELASRFSFDWLFLKIYSLEQFTFDLSFTINPYWGIGGSLTLPYLKVILYLPVPVPANSMIAIYNFFHRKTKTQK